MSYITPYLVPVDFDTFRAHIQTIADRARLMECVEGSHLATRLHTILDIEAEIRSYEHASQNLRLITQALFLDLDTQEFRRRTRRFWDHSTTPSESEQPRPRNPRRNRTQTPSPETVHIHTVVDALFPNTDEEPEQPPSHIGIRTVSPTGEEGIESVPRADITQYVDDLIATIGNASITEQNTRANGGRPMDPPSYADPTPPPLTRSPASSSNGPPSTPGYATASTGPQSIDGPSSPTLPNRRTRNIRCHRCHQTGHIRRECPTMRCARCQIFGHNIRNCPRGIHSRRGNVHVIVDDESDTSEERIQYPRDN